MSVRVCECENVCQKKSENAHESVCLKVFVNLYGRSVLKSVR